VIAPTSNDLLVDETRPYFLWWTDVTVGALRKLVRSPDAEERAYWVGALLREANSRDVWQFVRADDLRRDWPLLVRHLGRARPMWAWLLGVADIPWPPAEARLG